MGWGGGGLRNGEHAGTVDLDLNSTNLGMWMQAARMGQPETMPAQGAEPETAKEKRMKAHATNAGGSTAASAAMAAWNGRKSKYTCVACGS